MKAIRIFGTRIDYVSMKETLAIINHWINHGDKLHQICTVNPEFVINAEKDKAFQDVLENADLNVADGNGLIWASHLFGDRLPERVPGSDLVYYLAKQCAENGWRLYLLGAMPGVAEMAAEQLQRFYDGLIIAGTYAGSPDIAENDEIIGRINESKADVLYVAYGAPKQDKWIAFNHQNLTTVKVAIGVGGSVDFIAGVQKRAPEWTQKIGLEWFHRLLTNPSRWQRVMLLPYFGLRVLLAVLKRQVPQAWQHCTNNSTAIADDLSI